MLVSARFKYILIGLLSTLLLVLFSANVSASAENTAVDCEPIDEVGFVCGIHNVEKLIPVDGTRWAIGSAAGGGPVQVPPMYFLNLDTQKFYPLDPTTIEVKPDSKTFPNCPQPDFTKMTSAGMDIKTIGGINQFYVVNHGGTMATEIFEITTSEQALPKLTWKGCVTPPNNKWFMDDLAIFSDGSMIITNFFDPTDTKFVEKLSNGTPHGELAIWQVGTGWNLIPIGEVSGPNGIILSADEKTAYFADWGGHGVVKIDLASQSMTRVDLGFFVDNILWDEEGKAILAGGQNGSAADAFECLESSNANCDIPFSIVSVDPTDLTVTKIHGPSKIGVVGAGTGAMQDGDNLWLTSFRSDRLTIMPYPSEE